MTRAARGVKVGEVPEPDLDELFQLMLDLPELFGKYVLLERIAIGGMAEIFKARAQGLGGFEKLLAIKRLHPRYSEDEDFIRMLVDEAKIAVELSHANVGQIFDLGRHDDLVYIAMELIEGRDLYRLLKRQAEQQRRLPVEAAIFVAMEMLSALDYAHRKTGRDGTPLNIIHRDISPQNVLLSWEGEVKLVDFGIAKAASRAFETESGVIKGKFYYMSPEQARGDRIDQRSDIFSAGIVLYEMLTGTLLYGDENDMTLLSRVRRADIQPPTQLRGDIPAELERIVMKALRRDVRKRYQTAHHFHMALSNLLFSGGRPFGRVQLAQLMREEFGQAQVHPQAELDFSIHDRFLSRVDLTGHGAQDEESLLEEEGDDATIRLERHRAQAVLQTHVHPGRQPAHDPWAEAPLQGATGDFEGGATEAGGGLYQADDSTGIFEGRRPFDEPPPPPPARPQPPASRPAMPARAARPPAPPPPAPAPTRRGHADGHFASDVITGVYNEPTQVHLLAQPEGGDAAPDLFEVPLPLRVAFAVGLVVILTIGGLLSALGALITSPASGEEGGEARAAAEAPAAQAEEAPPAPTSLTVIVSNAPRATVRLGDDESPNPAVFSNLAPNRAYPLQITAPGFEPYRAEVEAAPRPTEHRVTLQPILGLVSVSSNPSGARILLDDQDTGKTTPEANLSLTLHERHTLRLELDGHAPYELNVPPSEDHRRSFEASLTALADVPDTGTEDQGEDAAPDDAKPDDAPRVAAREAAPPPRQPTPQEIAREREARERKAREARERREREARERREREEAAARRNANANTGSGTRSVKGDVGYLSVNSKPWGHVYLDGRLLRETPLRRHPTPVGNHTVKVVFPTLNGRQKSKTVSISQGKDTVVVISP